MNSPHNQTDPLLRADNHELFVHMRLMLVCRDPVIRWEEISEEFGGVPVDDLIAWFLAYRLPQPPRVMPKTSTRLLRDPALRQELDRLRRREVELVTIASESPAQLERVQRRIQSLERMH